MSQNLTANSIKNNVAQFYYRDENAPKPNKPNHIGTAVIIRIKYLWSIEQTVKHGLL